MLAKASKDGTAPVDILTDARHSTTKNSRHTDVICIRNNTKKVITYKTVTLEDYQITWKRDRLICTVLSAQKTLQSGNMATIIMQDLKI